MRRRGTIGRIIVLMILIILLVLGGLLWFDYLGLVNSRSSFAPIYSFFGLDQGTGSGLNEEYADIDADRLAKRLEAIDIRSQELDKKEADLTEKEKENLQISQQLDERYASIEDKEKSFNQLLVESDDRNANILQIAKYMNGMRPENAVANLLAMDDQDIIDVLRSVEAIAKREGTMSLVSYWFSLMPPARAAEIQRKMANKPAVLP